MSPTVAGIWSPPLADQLWYRLSLIDDRSRTTVQVSNEGRRRVDTEVVIDRRQEIAGATDAFDRVFAALVRGADVTTSLDAAAGPNVGKGPRPVIASWLLDLTAAGLVKDPTLS